MEKNNNNNVRFVNLSSYAAPEYKEVYNKEWVLYQDKDTKQDYFEGLIERYLDSPTNACCINGISDMIYGRGLESTDSEEKPEMYAQMKLLIKDSQVKKVVKDYKLLGQAAFQIIYNSSKTRIIQVLHFPMETLRAEKADEKGKIRAYYYHPKWSEIKHSDNPKRIPAFGQGSDSDLQEIYMIRPYMAGSYYYSYADYQSCVQYCDLEGEVSNYHINNIQNGIQPSLFINFNNGVPEEDAQKAIEKKINEKFGGTSNAGRAIIAFNEDPERKATIEAIHLPDAHAQYQFYADESREKIMLGHRIVSPILLGIKDNTGFGNNAEELRTASVIMDNVVIRPFQTAIIDGINDILNFNGIYLNLYFVTLQPIEFTELDNISTKVKKEEETGEKQAKTTMSKIKELLGFNKKEEEQE